MSGLLRSALPLASSESTKLFTARATWILGAVTILGTWPMAWTNAASAVGIAPDDPRLFSTEPIPLEFQGFDMAGFGYVLVVALAALWAGSEYGSGKQIRTTVLATPQRLRVFLMKTLLLAGTVAAIAFLTMWGTLVITHAAGETGVDPWGLTPAIWANLGGVTIAWTLTALIAFAVGALARTAILPLIIVVPLVIGVGDFLAAFWVGAKYLPVAAGAALYSDPRQASTSIRSQGASSKPHGQWCCSPPPRSPSYAETCEAPMIHTLRAEWTKALTLRSIQGTLAAALLVPPALSLASGLAFDGETAVAMSFPVESHGFETAGFGQPLIILLAALITGTEYTDGQLRTTLTATPRRGRVLAAKFTVIAVFALLVSILATSAAVLLKHTVLGEHGLSLGDFTAGMGWNLVGVAVNYTLIGLIAAAITVLARTFIVTLVVLVPLVLGLTISLLGVIPALKFLPDLAGIQLLTSYPGVGLLDPIPGGTVMATWTLLLAIGSWLAFRRRDTNG